MEGAGGGWSSSGYRKLGISLLAPEDDVQSWKRADSPGSKGSHLVTTTSGASLDHIPGSHVTSVNPFIVP